MMKSKFSQPCSKTVKAEPMSASRDAFTWRHIHRKGSRHLQAP